MSTDKEQMTCIIVNGLMYNVTDVDWLFMRVEPGTLADCYNIYCQKCNAHSGFLTIKEGDTRFTLHSINPHPQELILYTSIERAIALQVESCPKYKDEREKQLDDLRNKATNVIHIHRQLHKAP